MKIIIKCTPEEFFDLVKTQDQTEKSDTSNPFTSERAKRILEKLPRTVVTDDYSEFYSKAHRQLQEIKSSAKSKDD